MPKIIDHDERRDLIIDAVRRIILRGGFESATMREIASEAGFSHGALHRYFPTKNSLLAGAFVRVYSRANELADRALEGRRGLDALRTLCLHILPLGDSGRSEARIVVAFWDHAIQHPELWNENRINLLKWRAQMHAFLNEARDDGEISETVDISLVVDQITVMNTGYLVMSNLLREASTDDRQIAMLDAILDNLRVSDASGRESSEGAPSAQ